MAPMPTYRAVAAKVNKAARKNFFDDSDMLILQMNCLLILLHTIYVLSILGRGSVKDILCDVVA